MLRKFVFAVVAVVFSVGVLIAGEPFVGMITKVEGDIIYVKKGMKGEGEKKFEFSAEAKQYKVAKNVTVTKKGKKGAEPTEVSGGLSNDMFKNVGEKGVLAQITTKGDEVTAITIMGGKGKKKKDAGN